MPPDYVWMWQEDEAKSYEQLPGPWIVANVEQQIGWLQKKMLVKYQDLKLLLLPEENELYPAVALRLDSKLTDIAAHRVILQFLSSLTWAESNTIRVAVWSEGGMLGRAMRASHIGYYSHGFRITYLPDPENESARLALAFYREALSLKHIAYSFLSYYKIINLKFGKSEKQKAWIRRNLVLIKYGDAKKRLEELVSESYDVADYLYKSCRCAIAHAGVKSTIDPENFEDNRRLSADLPLIKKLAELIIEECYGIESSRKIVEEHLYELSGFKKILGDELVEKLKRKEPVQPTEVSIANLISVRLWGEKKFKALEKLKPSFIRANDGIIVLDCISEDKLSRIRLGLDFENERLLFNPDGGVAVLDDGSIKAAEFAADVQEFLNKYYGNGSLEVWNPQEEICLGRCDPFIPINIDLPKTHESFEKSKLYCLKVAEERKRKLTDCMK